MTEQENLNIFNKIKIMDYVATSIANYGEQCGAENLMEYLDLSCGAIPEGSFYEIIDLSAPEQFITLYTNIAFNRFAFSVSKVLQISEKTFEPMKQFCFEVGKNYKAENFFQIKDVFDYLDNFVLLSPDNSKNIISNSENEIVWKIKTENIKKVWNKFAETSNSTLKQEFKPVEIYFELISAFVNGLLAVSPYEFETKDSIFYLRKA